VQEVIGEPHHAAQPIHHHRLQLRGGGARGLGDKQCPLAVASRQRASTCPNDKSSRRQSSIFRRFW
jgi:hypothetical protein